MRVHHPWRFLLIGVLLLAACGSDEGDLDTEATEAPDEELTEEADEADEAEQAAGADEDVVGTGDEASVRAAVEVARSDLGEILVDADGMTLYLFTVDPDGESTCYDDCAAAWPPLVVQEEPAGGEGVDADLLGTTEREDGAMQVTYAGWPLYHWASDQAPGEVSGQGVNDVWFVVAPDGRAVGVDEAADEEEDAAPRSRY